MDGQVHIIIPQPSQRGRASLHQYRTQDAQLTRIVVPPNYVNSMFHGIESKHGTFIVGHRGTESSEARTAVSDLLQVRVHTIAFARCAVCNQ